MLSLNPLIPTIKTRAKPNSHWKFGANQNVAPLRRIWCSRNTDSTPQQQQQQLNLSVLRFTLGIPGLDESFLPRYIGYAFGGLLILNHFVGSDSSSITPAQLRTEALGLSLAAFSTFVPYLGKFLKGSSPTDKKSIPESAEQIFVMSQDITDTLKEDLAWGTYVLLRNTNSLSVLISVQDALCVRGYWNTPKDVPKDNFPGWFGKQIQRIGFTNLKDTAYFPQGADKNVSMHVPYGSPTFLLKLYIILRASPIGVVSLESDIMEMFPDGTRSLLVQPIMGAPKESFSKTEKSKGFVLLASSIDYAYNDKDKSWIAAVANKFGG